MKEGLHPENYRPVVFKDMSNGDMFLSRSTAKTNDTIEFEGETYPVVKVEISSSSHPFFTGKSKSGNKIVDDMRKKIDTLKEQLADLENKINQMDAE
jgi:large subunit ribosomal protein L31